MKRRLWITHVVGTVLVGGAAFGIAAGVRSGPASRPVTTRPADEARVRGWLGGNEEAARKIAQADPDYRAQIRQLGEEVRKQREELARVLGRANLSDQAVKDQLEKVITAQNNLERRVVDHVLKIRQHIPPEKWASLLRIMARPLGDKGGRFGGPGSPMDGGKGGLGGHRKTPESGPGHPGAGRERERERDRDRWPGRRPTSRPAETPAADKD